MTREQREAFEAVATPVDHDEAITVIRERLERWGALGLTAEVALKHRVDLNDVLSPTREHQVVQARHAAWNRLYRERYFSTPQIAALFGVNGSSVRKAILKTAEVRNAQSAA